MGTGPLGARRSIAMFWTRFASVWCLGQNTHLSCDGHSMTPSRTVEVRHTYIGDVRHREKRDSGPNPNAWWAVGRDQTHYKGFKRTQNDSTGGNLLEQTMFTTDNHPLGTYQGCCCCCIMSCTHTILSHGMCQQCISSSQTHGF